MVLESFRLVFTALLTAPIVKSNYILGHIYLIFLKNILGQFENLSLANLDLSEKSRKRSYLLT